MGDSWDGTERRLSPRFSGYMGAMKFRRLNPLPSGEPDVYHVANVVDGSKGGMCFATGHAITRGEKIEYYISSPVSEKHREGTARVVRVNRDPDRFFVAVEFLP